MSTYTLNKIYEVLRRFSDFEWLYNKLSESSQYKGLIIPPLPDKKYVWNMESTFIEKRREELENFLQIIATHATLKFDQHLKAFLTIDGDEFQNYITNPSKFEKVLGIYKVLPSIQNISLNSIQDAV